MAETLTIEVVYATALRQEVVRLAMAEGSSLEQAILASGLPARHPEIDLAACAVGIFGVRASLATVLRDQDRVEIYRPLRVDPKESRRQRAAQKKASAAPGRDGAAG